MANSISTRVALRGDTKDLMNKLQATKLKAKETSDSIHRGFSKTTAPISQINGLLGDNNKVLGAMSGSVNNVASSMAKMAVANPVLLGIAAAVAAAKIAYDELKRSIEDYTKNTEEGIVSIQAHNKALEEAVSVTRRLKEERSGIGELAENARQDSEAVYKIYSAGSTFWEKALDALSLTSGNFGKVAQRINDRGLDEGANVYNKVKDAQTQLINNERNWYRYGKLRVENLKTEAQELLLIANDKQKSDAERKQASTEYKRLSADAYKLERDYLTERHRLIVLSNEDSADDLSTIQSISDAQLAVNQLSNQYVSERRKMLRVDNEIDRRAESAGEKLQDQIDKYYSIEDVVSEIDSLEQSRLNKLNEQKKAIDDAMASIGNLEFEPEDNEDTATFDLADKVRVDSDKIKTKVEEMTTLMNQYMNEILTEGIAGTIENGIAAAFNPDLSFMDASLSMLADFASTFGKMLIAQGTAVEAFKESLKSLNGYAAIAAGAALIASSAILKNFISKKTKSFNNGGVFNSHYGDQLIARINPNEMILTPQQQANLFNMLKMGSDTGKSTASESNVRFEIHGDTLVGVLDNHYTKSNIF